MAKPHAQIVSVMRNWPIRYGLHPCGIRLKNALPNEASQKWDLVRTKDVSHTSYFCTCTRAQLASGRCYYLRLTDPVLHGYVQTCHHNKIVCMLGECGTVSSQTIKCSWGIKSPWGITSHSQSISLGVIPAVSGYHLLA